MDDLDLHLRSDEYDSENMPKPKFKKRKLKHIYEDTTSVRSKYNLNGKKQSPSRGSPIWMPTNPSPGFDSSRKLGSRR